MVNVLDSEPAQLKGYHLRDRLRLRPEPKTPIPTLAWLLPYPEFPVDIQEKLRLLSHWAHLCLLLYTGRLWTGSWDSNPDYRGDTLADASIGYETPKR